MGDIELTQVIGALEKATAFRAPELAGDKFLYVVSQEGSDRYTYERMELSAGLFLLKGESGAGTADEAYAWVQGDWPRLRNHLRWVNYMSNNPPPR